MHRGMKKWMIKLSGEPFFCCRQREEYVLNGSASEAGVKLL